MILYFDGLFYKNTGIGRYYESLVKAFLQKGIKIYTAVPRRWEREFEKDFSGYKNFEVTFVDYEKFSLVGCLKHSILLRKIEKRVDLFFFPHVNVPFYMPKKSVVVVHDLRPLTTFWDRSEHKRMIFKCILKKAIKASYFIVTVSETIANELKDNFKWAEPKVKVIYEFIEDKFRGCSSAKSTRIEVPYILFVGTRKKHKNLSVLINAFAFLKDKIPHYLFIAGQKESLVDEVDILIKKFQFEHRVKQILRADDETIINLYKNADLFVFPSLYEGFGLPPLEAVSLGCPVILSDIPIFREIFGDAGVYFDPYDPKDLADKILRMVSNSELKSKILKTQKTRLEIFNKDKIVNEYINLFNEILEETI